MQAQKDITFGSFRLDFTNECVWQGSRAISLRPKAFAVLKLLVAHSGQLVSKQQVLDTVWPGTFVGDAVLKDNIRQLREALNDDAASPHYIETAHRRGYRFIGQGAATSGIDIKQGPVSELPPRASAFPLSTPILGRETELAKMQNWLDRALASERQTVFVTALPLSLPKTRPKRSAPGRSLPCRRSDSAHTTPDCQRRQTVVAPCRP